MPGLSLGLLKQAHALSEKGKKPLLDMVRSGFLMLRS